MPGPIWFGGSFKPQPGSPAPGAQGNPPLVGEVKVPGFQGQGQQLPIGPKPPIMGPPAPTPPPVFIGGHLQTGYKGFLPQPPAPGLRYVFPPGGPTQIPDLQVNRWINHGPMLPSNVVQGPGVVNQAVTNSNPFIQNAGSQTTLARLWTYISRLRAVKDVAITATVAFGTPPDLGGIQGDLSLAGSVIGAGTLIHPIYGPIFLGEIAAVRGIIANQQLARRGTIIPADQEVLDMIERMEKVASHQIGPLDFTDP